MQLTRAASSAMSRDSAYCPMRRDCKGRFNPKAYLGPPAPTFKDTVAFAAARSLHSSLLATRCPPLCLTPSWSLGTFPAILRLPSDSASSWQFSTLLATWCTFPCSGVLAVRHLAPSCSRDTPLLTAWRCHSAVRTAPSSLFAVRLAGRFPPDHSTPSSLLDTLRSDRQPPGPWKLTVLLTCGSFIKLVVALIS